MIRSFIFILLFQRGFLWVAASREAAGTSVCWQEKCSVEESRGLFHTPLSPVWGGLKENEPLVTRLPSPDPPTPGAPVHLREACGLPWVRRALCTSVAVLLHHVTSVAVLLHSSGGGRGGGLGGGNFPCTTRTGDGTLSVNRIRPCISRKYFQILPTSLTSALTHIHPNPLP